MVEFDAWKGKENLENTKEVIKDITVVLWTSSHILYSLPLHQKDDVSKTIC